MTSIRKLKKEIRQLNWVNGEYTLEKKQIRRWLRGETRYNCCTQLRCYHVRRFFIMRAKKGRKQSWNK